MKKIYFLIICSLFTISCKESVKTNTDLPLIPIPNEVSINNGTFKWNKDVGIIAKNGEPDLIQIKTYFEDILSKSYPFPIAQFKGENSKNAIVLELDPSVTNSEGYILDINKDNITIKGRTSDGVFYGVQTLLQLMPPEVYKEKGLPETFEIQALSIKDSPRFSYRGMHLDVSRHFMTVDDVKKYIDVLAHYKFNRFHWHLTDGAGWRIEIKKYPLLTQKTAFRKDKNWKNFWNEGGRKFVDEGTPGAYGGYYTQDQIREVVTYAKERHITIIPEIEMPGHSEEVFVAYPQLSCSGIPYKDSDFCAGNEETFTFIDDVLSEIVELFPSEYIHIGGDEAGKSAWKTCPKCQKRLKDQNLKDLNELQSYFVKRVSGILEKKDRKLIGWDEIVDGGLPADATVMLWRDPQIAKKASHEGHQIIMTPGRYCYFDQYQANPATEPEAIGGYLTLQKVYSFDPAPFDSIKDNFIGGQGNVWVEYIPDFKHVEYMVFPRAIALSEVLWSDKQNINWENFKKRLSVQLEALSYQGVNYHKPGFELNMNQVVDSVNQKIKISFDSEQVNPVIRYTLDGSLPNSNSNLYTDTIIIDKAVELKAAIFIDNLPKDIFTKNLGYHKAVGKSVQYLKPWTSYPAGGETALTDGLIGGLTYSDDRWQGFTNDLDVIIDMGEVTTLNSFSANFMQLIGPDVYMPEYVEVFGSVDGNSYKSLLKVENDVPKEHDRLIFKNFGGNLDNAKVRYLKVFAKNQKGFIFTDELIVN